MSDIFITENTVPTTIVEKILHLQKRTDAMSHNIGAINDLLDDSVPNDLTPVEGADFRYKRDDLIKRRDAMLRELHAHKRDHGIYPSREFCEIVEIVTAMLDGLLRDDIPVSDYVNGLYRPDPISDFETTGSHEIPSGYSKTGNPVPLTM